MTTRALTYLPEGVYPGAAKSLIRLCQDYLAKAKSSAKTSHYDSGAYEAERHVQKCLGALTLNLMRLPGLNRSNWRVERPRLQLMFEQENNALTLSMFPSRESIVHDRNGDAGITDMGRFPYQEGHPFMRQYITYPRLIEWNLNDTEARMLYSEEPWSALSLQEYENRRLRYEYRRYGEPERALSYAYTPEGMAYRRRILKLSHDVILHRMSMMFRCAPAKQMVCFGPDALLTLHDAPSLDSDDDEDDSDSTPSAGLTPTVATLLQSRGIPYRELTRFLNNYLKKEVAADQQLQTLTDYLGLRERHKVTQDILETVQDEVDVDKQAARRAAAYLADPESLRKLVKDTRWDWQRQLGESLKMSSEELNAWLLVHFQDIFEEQGLRWAELRALYEERKKYKLPADKAKSLLPMLEARLASFHSGGRNKDALPRLNEAVRHAFDFEDLAAMSEWTRSAPALAPLRNALLDVIMNAVERQGRAELERLKVEKRNAKYREEKMAMSKSRGAQ